jgi:hypothetical protein
MKNLILGFLFVIGTFLGCSDSPNYILPPEPEVPDGPGEDQVLEDKGEKIPILAYVSVWWEWCWKEMYQELTDAGFTATLPSDVGNITVERQGNETPGDPISRLDECAAGSQQLILSPDLPAKRPDLVSQLKAHPAVWGWYISDEPGKGDLQKVSDKVKEIQAIDNTHPFYVNLLPTYGFANADAYREYIREYVEKVPLPYISYDNYPIYGNPRQIREDFYQNLEIVAEESRKAGKEMWTFALSTAHGSYPVPTIEDLRFQHYSSLAYGAQCLQYFTFMDPDPTADRNFHDAPLSFDWELTPVFDVVKAINLELLPMSKVFIGSTVLWTAHTGDIPQGCKSLERSQLPEEVSSLNISGGKGALVSLLEKGKEHFLVVVNHNIHVSVNVQLTDTSAVKRVTKEGKLVTAGDKDQQLGPGDILIYFWKK